MATTREMACNEGKRAVASSLWCGRAGGGIGLVLPGGGRVGHGAHQRAGGPAEGPGVPEQRDEMVGESVLDGGCSISLVRQQEAGAEEGER